LILLCFNRFFRVTPNGFFANGGTDLKGFFLIALKFEPVILFGSFLMNAELAKKAAEKVGNPNVLVNLISRRVRQLNSGGGLSRPLINDATNLGAADIALREILEDKIGWELPEPVELVRSQPKKRRKH
jgi:DNA-directed RNA polymerase subunit omega